MAKKSCEDTGQIMQEISLDPSEWVCEQDSESDYLVGLFEIRAKGRRPLRLFEPSIPRLYRVLLQRFHWSPVFVKEVIKDLVLESESLLTLEKYSDIRKIINYLEDEFENNS